ncbi:hypothetical protein Hanom_Chr03g00222681 [Helianthus anomalus]
MRCGGCWYILCGHDWTRFDSVRFGSVRFDLVRFGLIPTSRHSSVVRPRVRHAKHGAPQTKSR